MPRKKLTLEQRLEAARTLDALYRSTVERGARNESFAQEICMGLVARGLIERFWPAPKNSGLDRLGIDIICKTSGGYYFFDVKSSFTGVVKHSPHREYVIYPWLIVPYRGQAEAERGLLGILRRAPSCAILPKEVQAEIDHLTPNIVLLYEPSAIGKREQAVLDEIAEEKREEADRAARIKLGEKKSAAKAILSSNMDCRDKLARLEQNGICVINKWYEDLNTKWVVNVRVEIFGQIISDRAVGQKKKQADKKAAEDVVEQIIALTK